MGAWVLLCLNDLGHSMALFVPCAGCRGCLGVGLLELGGAPAVERGMIGIACVEHWGTQKGAPARARGSHVCRWGPDGVRRPALTCFKLPKTWNPAKGVSAGAMVTHRSTAKHVWITLT